jgi:transposase InsO family protein
VRWHRMGFAAYGRWKSRPRGGRPRIAKELRDLIRRMSLENPLWGATKIHGNRPTSLHSPWQNGHVERLIGSIRRECTDHLIVLNAEHLRRILAEYAVYYNQVRTHVALGKDAPFTRPVGRHGDIVAYPVLAGLHHRYARI